MLKFSSLVTRCKKLHDKRKRAAAKKLFSKGGRGDRYLVEEVVEFATGLYVEEEQNVFFPFFFSKTIRFFVASK